MRIAAFSTLPLALTLCVAVCAATPARAASPTDVAATVCDGKGALPLEVVGSRHFVAVELKGPKGTETVRFHVDSGGNTFGLLLDEAVMKRLGFAKAEALPRTLRIGGRELAVPRATKWLAMKYADPRGEQIASGQIGAGFFGHFLVCIDPGKGHIAFARPEAHPIDDDGRGLALELPRLGPTKAPYPFVHAEVGGQKVLLLFDTGATTSMLERKYLDAIHGAHADWPLVRNAAGDADMLGGRFPERLLRVPSLTVGGRDLGAALFVERPDDTWPKMFGVDEAHGALANDVLGSQRMLIDYKGAHVWLWPSGRAPDASASLTRVGVGLRYGADKCPEVRLVSSGNAPDVAARLQPGDVILAVDGKSVCDGLHHTAATALAGKEGQPKQLRIRRAGATSDVTVTVRDLTRPTTAAP